MKENGKKIRNPAALITKHSTDKTAIRSRNRKQNTAQIKQRNEMV